MSGINMGPPHLLHYPQMIPPYYPYPPTNNVMLNPYSTYVHPVIPGYNIQEPQNHASRTYTGKRKALFNDYNQHAKHSREDLRNWMVIKGTVQNADTPKVDPELTGDDAKITMPVLDREVAGRLSVQMKQFYDQNIQRDDTKEKKELIRTMLHKVILSIFPYTEVFITGSSVTGFGFKKSDLDLCVVLHVEEGAIDQRKDALIILNMLRQAYCKFRTLSEIEVVRAKVPILRFKDEWSGLDCDVNINNVVGIRNSFLLRGYAQCDWRIPILAVFVKMWAKCQNINDARTASISSYSWALMVIHYLQCGIKPAILTSLQSLHPEVFNESLPLAELRGVPQFPFKASKNLLSLADLFVGFLDYYGNKFDYQRDAISVRLGTTIPIADVLRRPSTDVTQWKCLAIEEPYNLSNTARSVHDQNTFKRVVSIMRKSCHELRMTGELSGILFKPL